MRLVDAILDLFSDFGGSEQGRIELEKPAESGPLLAINSSRKSGLGKPDLSKPDLSKPDLSKPETGISGLNKRRDGKPGPRVSRKQQLVDGSPLVASGRAAEGVASIDIISIFEEEYRLLRPRAPMPPFHVRFRRFVSLNTTIRLRDHELHVSLSDLLEGASDSVLHAIAHILIAKIYKKPISAAHNHRYKRFQYSEAVARQTEQIRSSRGAKRFSGPEGRYYNLDEVFDTLNTRFFHGLLGRPQLTWSEHHAKRLLGHYDAAHNTIVVSKVFDRPSSPRYAIEYLLYHEMLHLKHPVSVRGTRRCVHGAAFKADEAMFPQLREALAFLKRL